KKRKCRGCGPLRTLPGGRMSNERQPKSAIRAFDRRAKSNLRQLPAGQIGRQLASDGITKKSADFTPAVLIAMVVRIDQRNPQPAANQPVRFKENLMYRQATQQPDY